VVQVGFWKGKGTGDCTSPKHTGVMTNKRKPLQGKKHFFFFFCAIVTHVNTLTDSKPHFLTPQSAAKVSQSISNSTIPCGWKDWKSMAYNILDKGTGTW